MSHSTDHIAHIHITQTVFLQNVSSSTNATVKHNLPTRILFIRPCVRGRLVRIKSSSSSSSGLVQVREKGQSTTDNNLNHKLPVDRLQQMYWVTCRERTWEQRAARTLQREQWRTQEMEQAETDRRLSEPTATTKASKQHLVLREAEL